MESDWSTHVTTLILVSGPARVENRPMRRNFFGNTHSTVTETLENQAFSDFITEHIQKQAGSGEYTEADSEQQIPRYRISYRQRNLNSPDQRNVFTNRYAHYWSDETLRAYRNYVATSNGDSDTVEVPSDSPVPGSPGSETSVIPTASGIFGDLQRSAAANLEPTPRLKADVPANTTLNSITVELKVAEDPSKMIETTLSATLVQFRQLCSAEGHIKLYFQDALLDQNDRTLKDYGFYDKCMVKGELVPPGEVMTIRLKHLDDSVINAVIPNDATVGDLKRAHYAEKIAANRVIRFIFQGQLLRNDTRTLASYGVNDNAVIHVHVGQTAYRQEGVAADQQSSRPTAPQDNFIRGGPHPITGFQWLDTLLYTLLSSVLWLSHWAEADVLEDDDSMTARLTRHLRSAIRFVTGFFEGNEQEQNPELLHNFGNRFHTIIFLKIAVMLMFVYFYQDIADVKTVVLLLFILTFVFMYAMVAYPRGAVRR
ncbi:hypothetical protein FO519_000531 [Halicephalobus sp. NKZ332]|nr:hypothetical protein FO519_000531 [Halicephalobus sp. NKZ332]